MMSDLMCQHTDGSPLCAGSSVKCIDKTRIIQNISFSTICNSGCILNIGLSNLKICTSPYCTENILDDLLALCHRCKILHWNCPTGIIAHGTMSTYPDVCLSENLKG